MMQKQLNRKEFFNLYPTSLKKQTNTEHYKKQKRAHDQAERLKLALELGCRVEDL